MRSLYNVIDTINTIVSAEPFNNTVSFGDIADIDLQKQSMFPLAHIMVNNATINMNYVTLNVTVFFMDLVDVSNEEITGRLNTLFTGNDNTQDILNTQLALATRVLRKLQKEMDYQGKYQLLTSASCEPFLERFDNMLAGWAVTFDVDTIDEMTYCNE